MANRGRRDVCPKALGQGGFLKAGSPKCQGEGLGLVRPDDRHHLKGCIEEFSRRKESEDPGHEEVSREREREQDTDGQEESERTGNGRMDRDRTKASERTDRDRTKAS